jgi:hypothetical protein
MSSPFGDGQVTSTVVPAPAALPRQDGSPAPGSPSVPGLAIHPPMGPTDTPGPNQLTYFTAPINGSEPSGESNSPVVDGPPKKPKPRALQGPLAHVDNRPHPEFHRPHVDEHTAAGQRIASDAAINRSADPFDPRRLLRLPSR